MMRYVRDYTVIKTFLYVICMCDICGTDYIDLFRKVDSNCMFGEIWRSNTPSR